VAQRVPAERPLFGALQGSVLAQQDLIAPLEPAVAVASSRLPGDPHDDPAARIIVATARHLGATLVTADDQLLAYGTAGHVKVSSAV
jgi:PIN domain nuclease of toxin-antitoxin system